MEEINSKDAGIIACFAEDQDILVHYSHSFYSPSRII